MHHIDGDCTNNKMENLQLLCPNCHSLTSNFGSLNKNSKRSQAKENIEWLIFFFNLFDFYNIYLYICNRKTYSN